MPPAPGEQETAQEEDATKVSDSSHVHGMECYQILLDCGRTEHSHSGACWDKNGNSVCQRLEHSHNSSCNARVLCCNK